MLDYLPFRYSPVTDVLDLAASLQTIMDDENKQVCSFKILFRCLKIAKYILVVNYREEGEYFFSIQDPYINLNTDWNVSLQ